MVLKLSLSITWDGANRVCKSVILRHSFRDLRTNAPVHTPGRRKPGNLKKTPFECWKESSLMKNACRLEVVNPPKVSTKNKTTAATK
jgi:hypothetical protein